MHRGTFFQGSRIPVNDLLHFLHVFICGTTNQTVERTFGWSSASGRVVLSVEVRKMSKANTLREMSDEQLQHELQQTQQEMFRVRFQSATERNDTPSNVRKLRQTIARVKTIQREREIAGPAKVEEA